MRKFRIEIELETMLSEGKPVQLSLELKSN